MYKVITEEHMQFIKEHPEMTDREIGEIFNIKPNTIRGARQKLGLYKDKKIDISKEEFLKVYNECNKKLYIAAKILNTNRTTLKKIANSYGIKTDRLLNLSENDIDDICASYSASTSLELSKKYNCSPAKISAIWAQHGLVGKTKRVYHLDESYFDNIDTPAKAYFIGFIAADGCLYNTDNPSKSAIVKITISSEDEKILKLFQAELNTDKPINYINTNGRSYATLEICSNNLYNALINIGITPIRKTYGNTIPVILDSLMPHFIRGYFDGDGSVPNEWGNAENKNKSKVHAGITGYKKNMIKIVDYLESKNIYSTFVVDKRHYNGDCEFGEVSISNYNSVYCFLKLIYNNCGDFFLDRKKSIADNIIKHVEENDKIRYKQIVNYYKYAVQAMC